MENTKIKDGDHVIVTPDPDEEIDISPWAGKVVGSRRADRFSDADSSADEKNALYFDITPDDPRIKGPIPVYWAQVTLG